MKRLFSRLDYNAKQALILGAMCGMFWFAMSCSNFQTIYLQNNGFTASQLGLLNAISSGVSIAAVTFWGMVSDRIRSLRKVLILILVLGCGLYAIVPIVPTSPLILTVFLPFVNFFRGSQGTFCENLLVRNCNELHLNHGVLRAIGSFVFTIGSTGISLLMPYVGVNNTFWLTGVLMTIPLVLIIFAREPNAKTKTEEKKEKLDLSPLFHNRSYIMFLVFTFIFYLAACSEASFLPYFMTDVGIPSERYGFVLAVRALMEVPFLILMVKLRKRFSLRALIAISAIFMALECIGFCFLTRSLPTLLLFCSLFGLGNGIWIGSTLNYVYELAPDHLKASAQAFFSAVSSVSGILGNLIGGVVYDAIGAKPFYLVVAATYFVSVGIFVLSFDRKKKQQIA